jgi:hypothetical protein
LYIGGIGTAFGPRCHVNDVLGCGIVFPSHLHATYSNPQLKCEGDGESESDWPSKTKIKKDFKSKSPSFSGQMDNILEASSESEDDIWWNNRQMVYEDKVQVFTCLSRYDNP